MDTTPDDARLRYLRALAHRFPNEACALAEMAQLRAKLALPKGTVHVISDVHGEHEKLKHVVNNASGSLRPLVERLFAGRLAETERNELLSFVYYPREAYDDLRARVKDAGERATTVRWVTRAEVEILRSLAHRYALRDAESVFPTAFAPLLRELIASDVLGRSPSYVDALLEPFLVPSRAEELLRLMAHAIRNLSIAELVVAGDLGDRGPRIDKVIGFLMKQPNVSFTWGNHDAVWMGACLGETACIATVLRNSLRYGRIAQLEEGYGIPVEPIEQLAHAAYGDDPAERFLAKGEDLRDAKLLARMQKAMTILQLKVEAQLYARNPHFELGRRDLLARIDYSAGTVDIDGTRHPLLDKRFPTVDPANPSALSREEKDCLDHLQRSFLDSTPLWEQMKFVAARGAMHLIRDRAVIFHGCIPVDDRGEFLSFPVDGAPRTGRGLFDALYFAVQRAFRERRPADLDLLYYLWAGPRSPCFGKDKMATFETYFVADKSTHKETKNPYFRLIHDADFCTRVAAELGASPAEAALIVNGHVPVKVEEGESPLKKSNMAITIDGAFSEAYGDRGYTLVLDADRTYLAQHHHFASVGEAVTRGADIIPTIQDVRVHEPPRTVADTAEGDALRRDIDDLRELVHAYEANLLRERLAVSR